MNTKPLTDTKPLLSSQQFNLLRRFTELVLPALATFYFTMGGLWGWPKVTEVMGSIAAVSTLCGVILIWLRNQYENSTAKYDGEMVVNLEDPMKDTFRLEVPDPVETIPGSDELRLRVRHEK